MCIIIKETLSYFIFYARFAAVSRVRSTTAVCVKYGRELVLFGDVIIHDRFLAFPEPKTPGD